MEISIDRAWKRNGYTISRVFIDGARFGDGRKWCSALEDEDRGLTSDMSVDEILQKKVYGKTAIPTGRYLVTITWSPKFRKDLPLVNVVKGFTGVRLHSGNTSSDTYGCILFGENDKVGCVSNSRYWSNMITGIIKAAIGRGEKVYLKVG